MLFLIANQSGVSNLINAANIARLAPASPNTKTTVFFNGSTTGVIYDHTLANFEAAISSSLGATLVTVA